METISVKKSVKVFESTFTADKNTFSIKGSRKLSENFNPSTMSLIGCTLVSYEFGSFKNEVNFEFFNNDQVLTDEFGRITDKFSYYQSEKPDHDIDIEIHYDMNKNRYEIFPSFSPNVFHFYSNTVNFVIRLSYIDKDLE